MYESKYTEDIKQAVEVLRKGGVILYPTDTVWGIGCDARNEKAVEKIFAIKRRSEAKAMITLVDSCAALERVVDDIPDVAYQLIEVSVAPTTIVYDNPRGLAPNLRAEDGSAGVRVTSEAFSSALCCAFRAPIVSTSANISGEATPGSFAEISPEIIEAVDYVCTSRRDELANSKPSTVIKISSGGVFKILRK